MKKAFALWWVIMAVCAVRAAGQDFTLINKTGFGIHSVFITPHGTDEWQEDLLGSAVLYNGDYTSIKYDRDDKAKRWDLKVNDKEGNSYVWENIDLPGISKITVEYKDRKPSAVSE